MTRFSDALMDGFQSPRPRGRLRVAIGPEMPGWGSWDWVGSDMFEPLSEWFDMSVYGLQDSVADADVVLIVKHLPPLQWWNELPETAQVVYLPIDHYGSGSEIDADGRLLRRCARIAIHCERLRRYFAPYAPVEYIDHHVKYVRESTAGRNGDGPILWVGVRTNLPMLVDWLNRHRLPRELLILTNPEDPQRRLSPRDCGIRPGHDVRIETWSPERHRQALGEACAALDIKGDDFRSQHKPPAKAIDFLASGLPLAMNADSSPVEHLARMGFDVASPDDVERWLSPEYAHETRRFGGALRELLSLERVARRYRRIIEHVFEEQRVARRKTQELALVR